MYSAQSTNWDTFQIELEFISVGFWGEGKTGVPGEKPLGARTRTNNKLNPHMTRSPGNRTRATLVGGERSYHCTIPAPPIISPFFFFIFRKGFQLAFGDLISLDMYKLFFQLLSQAVVWLGILLLILMCLLPDIIFMLIGRHFFPSETQKVQVTLMKLSFLKLKKKRYR